VHGQLAREFAELAHHLHQQTEFEQAAHELIDLARRATGCDHAGILLMHDGVMETVDATDPAVEKADQLENELHEGPGLAVSPEHDLYRIDDTLADEQWPRWSTGAAALGLRSVISARLPMSGGTTGALTLYGDQPSGFGSDAGAVARALAQHAAVVAQSAPRGLDPA
jgi:GAF domain-containing protein